VNPVTVVKPLALAQFANKLPKRLDPDPTGPRAAQVMPAPFSRTTY